MKLVRTYTYNPTIYTEALELLDDRHILISSGRYGTSHLGIYDLEQQTYTAKKQFTSDIFAEGATRVDDTIWLLTFKEGTAFKFSYPTFSLEDTYSYTGDGWGLAYDADRSVLWMSNGTATLQIRDPQNFELLQTLEVTKDDQPLVWINELEYVNGYLYANIWQSHTIIKIDVETGAVVQTYQLTPLLEEATITPENYPNIDVLNGIAHIRENEFLLSGKYYPYLLRVVLD